MWKADDKKCIEWNEIEEDKINRDTQYDYFYEAWLETQLSRKEHFSITT